MLNRKMDFNGNKGQAIKFLYDNEHYIISFVIVRKCCDLLHNVGIIWLVDLSTFFRHAQTSYWVTIYFATTTLIHDALQKCLAFRKYVCKG